MTQSEKLIIENLVKALCSEQNNDCTSITLFVNAQGYEIKTTHATPEQLKADGVSMRNIKGEWIK